MVSLEDLAPSWIAPIHGFVNQNEVLFNFLQDIDGMIQPVPDYSGNQGSTYSQPATAPNTACDYQLEPEFQIIETGQGIALIGKMPGMAKESLSLAIADGPEGQALEIFGGSDCPAPSQEPTEGTTGKFRYAKFERSIPLSSNLDSSSLEAKYHDGLLVATIQKATKSIRRNVTIG